MIFVPHMAGLDLALAVPFGVRLSAAAGFRVFLPMVVLSLWHVYRTMNWRASG